MQYLKQHTRHTHVWPGLVSQSYGGHSGRETPGPIPNPEAKPASADGTALARVWESRSPPNTTSHARTPESPTGPGVLAISTSDLFAVCAGNSVVAPQKSCELPIRYKSHRRRLFAGGVAGTVSAGLISATAAPAHTGSMVYTSLPGTMRCSPAR